jgi:hypothetical protein
MQLSLPYTSDPNQLVSQQAWAATTAAHRHPPWVTAKVFISSWSLYILMVTVYLYGHF